MEEEQQTIIVKEKPRALLDGKTLVIGGGIVAAILYFLFRGGSGGAVFADRRPLLFKLHSDGLYLNGKSISVTDALARIIAGKRKDMTLQVAGDVPEGTVNTVVTTFQASGIQVYQQQPTVSLYARGLGSIA